MVVDAPDDINEHEIPGCRNCNRNPEERGIEVTYLDWDTVEIDCTCGYYYKGVL